MQMSSHLRLAPLTRFALGAGLLALAGCGGNDSLSRSLGLSKTSPDEFSVTTRAPLSMPPEMTLPRPQPGAPRPQEAAASKSPEATLAPGMVLQTPGGATSAGQDALVKAAGPTPPADIRAQVSAEGKVDPSTQSLTDRLTSWTRTDPAVPVVDPAKEADRLNTNAALGKPVDTGNTPVVKKQRGWLTSLFE